MILEIHHETRLEYSSSVIESLTEVRMEPVSDDDQSVRSFYLSISPAAETHRFYDGFGNRVHHFNVLSSCQEVRIVGASVVETHPQVRQMATSQAVYPLAEEDISLAARGFIAFRGPVSRSSLLEPLLSAIRARRGMPLAELVMNTAAYICSNFEYAKHVTLASSPIDDLLRERKGVCQDFTHLLIALCRSFGIPARYVSGYVHRPNKESQSHAWCEVWLPDLGWCGLDPTNDREVDGHFVKVATGRDFTDVPPNKGVYRGKADEQIFVRVETRELDRLPSLAWQETLPTFEIPLTAINSGGRYRVDDVDPQHQQQ